MSAVLPFSTTTRPLDLSNHAELVSTIARLVQTLSARFMQAEPREENGHLQWLCAQLGQTLQAEVVAVRDGDTDTGMTTMVACWTRVAEFQSHVNTPIPIRGDRLPVEVVVARYPSEMPICPPGAAVQSWVADIGIEQQIPTTLFIPVLDGAQSTGFVCVVLGPDAQASPHLIGLLSSVTAVVSQFRKRVAAERLLRRQMDLTALQGRIAELFAMARSNDAERVLTDSLRSIGEHLGALTLSLWKLNSDNMVLTRKMRWTANGVALEVDAKASVQLSADVFASADDPWAGVAKVPQDLVVRHRRSGPLLAEPPVQDLQLWTVPIALDGEPEGCLVLGLPSSRTLYEWEAVGLRAIATLVPIIQSRFAAEDHLTMALSTSPTGVTLRSASGELIDCNQAFCDFVGFSREQLIGTTPDQFMLDFNEELLRVGAAHELAFRSVAGDVVWGRVTSNRLSPLHGDRLLCHIEDVTIERAEREELLQQAHYDALTGLPNRHGFADLVARPVPRQQLAEHQAHSAVLMIDINEFKGVNDQHGHMVGDAVLREVSARLQDSIRSSDRAVRYGGDEFVVLIEGPLTANDAMRIAANLHGSMSDPVMVEGIELLVTLSVGATLVWGELADEFGEVLHRADVAMYRAKDRGPGSTELLSGAPMSQRAESVA